MVVGPLAEITGFNIVLMLTYNVAVPLQLVVPFVSVIFTDPESTLPQSTVILFVPCPVAIDPPLILQEKLLPEFVIE